MPDIPLQKGEKLVDKDGFSCILPFVVNEGVEVLDRKVKERTRLAV
jgi:hypothetical protein